MIQRIANEKVPPALTGTAGRIGKDDARGSLASHAKLGASVLEVPALRAHRLCNQGDHGATERG
jgi:hypothetical protein